MNRLIRSFLFAACLFGAPTALLAQPLKLPLEFRQNATLYNFRATRGVPISTVSNVPPGSDGRMTNDNSSAGSNNLPTTNQFQGFISFGGVPGLTNGQWQTVSNDVSLALSSSANQFNGAVAVAMKLPVGTSNNIAGGPVAILLRRGQIGAPYLSRQVSFPFGSIVQVPETDENGILLSNIVSTAYWLPEPFTTTGHTNSGYYWSPHAARVYAIQAGPLQITWKKAAYVSSQPADYIDPISGVTNYFVNGGNYFRLYTASYIVSGSPAKPPRTLYWTEKGFRSLGKPVVVPSARVGAVSIAYNNNFPRTVTTQYVGPGDSSPGDGSTNQSLQELRTLWYDSQQGNILAYNREGRVFLELLGDPKPDGQTREQLGIEIVDVVKNPSPLDVTSELGELLDPPAPGTRESLTPEPILQPGAPTFAYQQYAAGGDRLTLYATRETANLNDYLVHWMEEGEAGLKWPKLFGRYRMIWPADVARYSHYVRPLVATEAEAKATAVALPNANAPTIEYQDPLDMVRGKLTETFGYYTFLDPAHPLHRALLRFSNGDQVAFERVFSWLDVNLKSPNTLLAGTVATNLTQWTVAPPFSAQDFRDLPGFAAKLLAAADPLSAYLKSRLSPATLTALAAYNGTTGAGANVLLAGLVADLNFILNGPGSIDPDDFTAPGTTWTEQLGGGTNFWTCIASSANGRKLAAVAFGVPIHTSTDAGVTWTAQPSGSRTWTAIASSADGTKLAAVVGNGENGPVYTSTDSGVTWTAQASPIGEWAAIASSADGTKLAAAPVRVPPSNSGPIYTSTDSGVTWTARPSSGIGNWRDIASSADGTKLVAINNNLAGALVTSTDSGVTWVGQANLGNQFCIASSSDGSKLAVGTVNGPILTSTNSGATWTAQASGSNWWYSIASSADGTKLAAAVYGGQIYTSTNSGVTWTAQASGSRQWTSITSSDDGTTLAATSIGDQIYTSATTGSLPAGTDPYQFNRSILADAYPDDFFPGQSVVWPDSLTSPRVVNETVDVGERINAPVGEPGAMGNYLAGHIHLSAGTSFNPNAYVDPLASGFTAANQGAIIPVNAIPGTNTLEVWWFRTNATSAGANAANRSQGFLPVYWPSVIGHYTIQWPANPREIVLASKLGSGTLDPLEALGTIYYQNDPALAGYNANEEHAIMSGGTAFATRDDLNITNTARYSSHPFVLVAYAAGDGRPDMSAFKVLREKREAGWVFDYVVPAGQLLQAPMPLPLLAKPVEGSGDSAINYNTEPTGGAGDLPGGWESAGGFGGVYAEYAKFTYQDRKNDFWVYRGLHAGLPTLEAGTYEPTNQTFLPLTDATAIVGQPFVLSLHVSREYDYLSLATSNAPAWLSVSTDTTNLPLAVVGTPGTNDVGTSTIELIVRDVWDQSSVTNSVLLQVVASGTAVAQGPLVISSTNSLTGSIVAFSNRPPFLARSPNPSNSFTMRYYYKTEASFAWPGVGNPPPPGSIVPYLRPLDTNGVYVGDATDKNTAALDIVYRPVWPEQIQGKALPTVPYGLTLVKPQKGLPGIGDWKTAEVLYQQSIAADLVSDDTSVVLHDPTRAKTAALADFDLEELPASVRTEYYQGNYFFPNLPPHLVKRLYYDPAASANGSLVLKGEFKSEIVGESYLLLNVLRGSDLDAARELCPAGDTENSPKWVNAIDGLATSVETFYENPLVPGSFIPNPALTVSVGVEDLAEVTSDNVAKDSYALSATGPGSGYVTLVEAGGNAFTEAGDPVAMHIFKVGGSLWPGQLKVIASDNPLSELVTFQHTPDLAGRFDEYEYEWKIAAPVDGLPPYSDDADTNRAGYLALTVGTNQPRYTLGGSGIQVLGDNYVLLRYRPIDPAHPLYTTPAGDLNAVNWSEWTRPQLAEGWIKRVLAGINPFNQRVTDLFNNAAVTDASILTSAGRRWEGDVALNLDSINGYGLIEIYETVLRRGRSISIESGYNYGPANDALLLAAGYLNDLYMMIGNEAWADAANPTIGIGTANNTYGDIATALFAFKGQEPSLLEEELALLRGRDDFLLPGVDLNPFYNRLVWNYTRGIDAGEVIYALNYNILDQNNDGVVDAEDAAQMFPQGHGDAYGHYLTALQGYYSLLLNKNFDWVPRIEAVTVLGAPVSVDYLDERKFAAAAAAAGRAGQQIFDLTWRRDFNPGNESGWEEFEATRENTQRTYNDQSGTPVHPVRYWGLDHWASRTGQGNYLNWVVGNAILPAVDPNPNHEGIQKIDRTTVPELTELATMASDLQTALDNAEGGLTPLGLPQDSIALDINPNLVAGAENGTHFEQIYGRAKTALQNAIAAFDDAKDVTRLMRSEQDSLAGVQAAVAQQELAYNNALIELYGTPYTDDIGPGKTYKQGYTGPDIMHYLYVDLPEETFPELWSYTESNEIAVEILNVPRDWQDANNVTINPELLTNVYFNIGPHGFFDKPTNWTGRRASPGRIQQAASEKIAADAKLRQAVNDAAGARNDFVKAVSQFKENVETYDTIRGVQQDLLIADQVLEAAKFANGLFQKYQDSITEDIIAGSTAAAEALPRSLLVGVSSGGDLTSVGRSTIEAAGFATVSVLDKLGLARDTLVNALDLATSTAKQLQEFYTITPLERKMELQQAVQDLGNQLGDSQALFWSINASLRARDDADRKLRALVAAGDRIQAEREVARQRTAAVVQGYRTRDAAFRIFRNEKLERYKTLFDLSARYAFLAANAYDYETGLLNTSAGRGFVSRIISSRALGVVRSGEPQFAGSATGDPGLSSALAEMKADWDVVKGRLGFNNPDVYGTTVSLRTENFRILPSTNSDTVWTDLLQRNRLRDITVDEDVRRHCLQISRGDGIPVPGIIIEFSTTIANGYNLFGQQLAAGDHAFSPSSFATKIFGVGAALEGYLGMDEPAANGDLGGITPPDPNFWFLDPLALAATPYVYLIPVGVDSMRSPPLGDASAIRSWTVADVAIPLPFNIGASQFASGGLYLSADSLSEPLFANRKHQAFRPVPSASFFSTSLYGQGGTLQRSQYTNNRLIGRSAWNSRWKLVIPGHTLLNDPDDGLDRFIQTVRDVKLQFVTYSYSGN